LPRLQTSVINHALSVIFLSLNNRITTSHLPVCGIDCLFCRAKYRSSPTHVELYMSSIVVTRIPNEHHVSHDVEEVFLPEASLDERLAGHSYVAIASYALFPDCLQGGKNFF